MSNPDPRRDGDASAASATRSPTAGNAESADWPIRGRGRSPVAHRVIASCICTRDPRERERDSARHIGFSRQAAIDTTDAITTLSCARKPIVPTVSRARGARIPRIHLAVDDAVNSTPRIAPPRTRRTPTAARHSPSARRSPAPRRRAQGQSEHGMRDLPEARYRANALSPATVVLRAAAVLTVSPSREARELLLQRLGRLLDCAAVSLKSIGPSCVHGAR